MRFLNSTAGRVSFGGVKRAIKSKAFWFFQRFGVHILPVHYYSPVPDLRDLKSRQKHWYVESEMPGIKWDLKAQKVKLKKILSRYVDEIGELPRYDDIAAKGFGQGYGPVESAVLYAFLRWLKPKRFLEIGSGISTYYAALAMEKNRLEGSQGTVTCIEPYAPDYFSQIRVDTLHRKRLEEVDIALFRNLSRGDMVFIDSTHTVKIGNDVTRFYLDILPRIAAGVTVHIHDIPFPFPTPKPEYWIYEVLAFWSEPALVQAVLQNNNSLAVEFCLSYLHLKDPDFLKSLVSWYDPRIHYPSSLYWQRAPYERNC